MEPEIIGAYIGGGVSLAVGIGGIIAAGIANSRAKKANQFAKAANRFAAKAVAQSATANQIAEDANELSEKANALSERALLHASEESFVQWGIEWDAENTTLVLLNNGRDVAFQPSVIVTGKELHQVGSGEDTPPGKKISIPVPQIVEKRAIGPRVRYGTVGGSSISVPRALIFPVSVVVLWKTENGFQREERIEFKISEGKRKASVW